MMISQIYSNSTGLKCVQRPIKFIAFLLFSNTLLAAHSVAHKVGTHSEIHNSEMRHVNQVSQKLKTVNASQALIQEYLVTGDDHLLEELESLLTIAQPSENTMLAQAWLLQALHKFKQAEHHLDEVLLSNPKIGQAWLTKAAILSVQGKIQDANAACGRATELISYQVGIICKAKLSADPKQRSTALSAAETVLPHLRGSHYEAWAFSVVAELAVQTNQYEKAERYFVESIEHLPSVQVRSSYIDLLLNKKRYGDVIDVAGSSLAAPLRVRSLMARTQMKQTKYADLKNEIAEVDHLFEHWIEEGHHQHAREMAMFYLDVLPKPEIAFTLAEINLQNQNEPEDNMLFDRARSVLAKAKRSKTSS